MLSEAASDHQLNPIKLPDWWNDRAELSFDYFPSAEKYDGSIQDISSFPMSQQESLIVHDLILCLSGVEGRYVKTPTLVDNRDRIRSFHIDRGLNASLRELSKRILELCVDYSYVIRFQQSFGGNEAGQVVHALCDSISDSLKNYHVFVGRLCAMDLSLHALWCHCQPMKAKMATLARVVEICWPKTPGPTPKSAVIINKIRDYLNETIDPSEQAMIRQLLNEAIRPYVDRMLPKWLSSGLVPEDPYNEFALNDPRAELPYFLEPFRQMMIDTGRYLSILRRMRVDNNNSALSPVKIESGNLELELRIRNSYKHASRALFNLAVGQMSILGSLTSIANHFLLRKADFLVHFLDTADQELRLNVEKASPTRLDALLDLTIRTSCLSADQHTQPLRTCFLDCDLVSFASSSPKRSISSMPAFELITLDREFPWPLDVSDESKKSLQHFFHHLFYLKFIERALSNVGRGYMHYHRKSWTYKSATIDIAAVFALRQRMLHFVQNLLFFTCLDVIEPNWVAFMGRMNKLTEGKDDATIDDISSGFLAFVQNCMQDSLLTSASSDVLNHVYNALSICKMFASQSDMILRIRAVRTGSSTRPSSPMSRSSSAFSINNCSSSTDSSSKQRYGVVFVSKFSRAMRKVVQALQKMSDSTTVVSSRLIAASDNMLARLDYNRYYRDFEEVNQDACTF